MTEKTSAFEDALAADLDFEVLSAASGTQFDPTFLLDVLSRAPRSKLSKAGWIDQDNYVSDIFKLLISGPIATKEKTFFRRQKTADDVLVGLWLSKVALSAKEEIVTNSLVPFQRELLSKEYLQYIAKLSADVSNVCRLKDELWSIGVVLVYQRGPAGLKTDGATFTLANGTPVIGMSLRYGRLDNFWFTLLHEMAHVCLHYDGLDEPIVDDMEEQPSSDIEIEANVLTKLSIVNKVTWRTCPARTDRKTAQVISYAREQGVHPAIIAGLLQHELKNYSLFRTLIDQVDVRELLQ